MRPETAIACFFAGFFGMAAIYKANQIYWGLKRETYELKNEYQKVCGCPPPEDFSKCDIRETLKIYEISHK